MNIAINGRTYTELWIRDLQIAPEILDGEATGRSKARGWPMIRDPDGSLINFAITFAPTVSTNADFIHLWNTYRGMGSNEFAAVRLVDPLGNVIEQNMYIVIAPFDYTRIDRNGVVYVPPIRVTFIAERGN